MYWYVLFSCWYKTPDNMRTISAKDKRALYECSLEKDSERDARRKRIYFQSHVLSPSPTSAAHYSFAWNPFDHRQPG